MDLNIKKNCIAALIYLLFSFNLSFAQSGFKDKENFLEAESYFLYEEFNEALPIYIQLKEKQPQNYNLDYKIGRCYLNMPYEKKKAITYLEIAVKHISTTYKDKNYKETMAPVDALFYLGDAYRINNQLDKAIETYKLFKTKCQPEKYDIKLVDLEIASCARAKEAMKNPIDYDEQNLGNEINTRYSETNPVVSQDESTLVYSSKLPFYDALFYSKKVNEKWQNPVNMIPELGVDDDCFPSSISYDGNELYLYRSNEYKGDIFVTYFVNGKWTKIKKLNGNINTKYWESHASISRDGKSLYFTSNREGGFGGLDIYVSQRTKGDDWGPAQNLGPVINSSYNEETPFIMSDDKTLYFSSFDHGTLGGYDIFYSYKTDNNTWSKPVNVGYPISTTDDDFFFCPLRDGKIAYISKYDPNGAGRFDITKLTIYTNNNPRFYKVKGITKLPQDGDTGPLYFTLYDKIKKDTIFKKTFNGNEINFDVIPGQYEINVSSGNNHFESIPFAIKYGSKDVTPEISLNLVSVPTVKIAEKQQPEAIEPENKTASNIQTNIEAKPDDLLSYEVPDNNSVVDNRPFSDSIQTSGADSTIIQSENPDIENKTSEQQLASVENPNNDETGKPSGNIFKNKYVTVSGIVLISSLLIILLILYRKNKNNKPV